jgi:hypothetical protein
MLSAFRAARVPSIRQVSASTALNFALQLFIHECRKNRMWKFFQHFVHSFLELTHYPLLSALCDPKALCRHLGHLTV